MIKISREGKKGKQKGKGTTGAKRRKIPAAKKRRETFGERNKGDKGFFQYEAHVNVKMSKK